MIIVFAVFLAVNPLCSAVTTLRDSITRYDVAERTRPENVKAWNAIIRAQRRVREVSGCK